MRALLLLLSLAIAGAAAADTPRALMWKDLAPRAAAIENPFAQLTTDQLKERDQIVFDDLLGRRIPVAWNLAGGYQRDAHGSIQPVLDIHNHTLSAFATSWARAWALRG